MSGHSPERIHRIEKHAVGGLRVREWPAFRTWEATDVQMDWSHAFLVLCQVVGFTDTPAGHTVYNLSCRVTAEGGVGRKTFVVDRRFSEFQELHAEIQPLFQSIPASFPVSKSVFSSEATKRERVEKFQDYLRAAVSAAGPAPPPALLRFLGVDASKIEEAVATANRGEVAVAPGRPQPDPELEPCGSPFGVVSAASSSDNNEALRDGIKGDNTAECLRLLAAKVDPNFRDRRGDCPLHLACMFNRTQVVKALLEHGADPKLKNAAGELPTKIASVTLRMKIDKFQSTGTF